MILEAGEVYRSNQDGAYVCEFNMTGEELMEFFSIPSDILTKKAEVVAQIVMGEADVSALVELKSYAQNVGLDRAIELVQTAYDRSNS